MNRGPLGGTLETISNQQFLLRLGVGAATFAFIGFVCGYFGPLYLLEDAGVGPLTGFFAAPVGFAVGGAAAVWGSVKGFKPGAYAARIALVAVVFAAVILALVVVQ